MDQPYNSTGETPLWGAACRGNLGVVRLLLSAGADPGISPHGISALECARRAREDARTRRPSILDGKRPYVQDFDGVIATLEQALAKRKNRSGRL